MANLLIIDDDEKIRSLLYAHATELGHNAAVAETLGEGFELTGFHDFDLVFLDVRLPDGNGLEALPGFRKLATDPEVIIITGVGDAAGAELAITSGAWDYLQKPFTKQEIILHITRAIQFREKKTRIGTVSLRRDGIIGSSPQIFACLDKVAQCATSTTHVLLTGETGTGKELFARTIHENSQRSEGPFVVVDCASLTETLVESTLFGHQKGAYTGAEKDRTGLVAQANAGTLFLDEIGELPLHVQKSFLRIIQEKTFRPVGGNRELESNFRLISATNQNLEEMVNTGRFRKDLLFRIRAFHIHLPALKERPGDIKELTKQYINAICESHGLKVKGYVPEFLDLMTSYNWPGNVRELIHTIENAIVADPANPTLYPFHLPPRMRIQHAAAAVQRKKMEPEGRETTPAAKAGRPDYTFYFEGNPSMKEYRERILEDSERSYFQHLLNVTGGDTLKARRISDLSKSRFYTLLRKHKIDTQSKP